MTMCSRNQDMKTNTFFIIIFSLIIGVTSCTSKRLIYDKAKTLDAREFTRLDSLLKAYKDQTNCEIIVYTQDKLPDNMTGEEYSLQLFKDIGIGQKGINNGALIFISVQDRKIALQLGYGFEWVINKDTANIIIQKMVGSFSKAKFADGIFKGVDELIRLTEPYPWKIKSRDYTSLNGNDIVEVKDYKLIDSSKDYLIIKTNNSDHLKLNFTSYMTPLAHDIINNRNQITLWYRVLSSKNDVGDLLGIK